jgi:putative hydrolase of the HAD superfamily
MNIKAVIFDLEGTLFRSNNLSQQHLGALIQLIAERRGVSILDAKSLFDSERKKLAKQLGYVPTTLATIRHIGISLSESYGAIEQIDPKLYIKPDASLRENLTRLQRRYKIALLTNMSKKTTRKIISALRLEDKWFNVITTGDIVSKLKPAEEPFILTLHLLGVSSQNTVMVGDRISIDLIPAKKLGMRTVLISRKETRSGYVDCVIDNINRLPKILENMFTNI